MGLASHKRAVSLKEATIRLKQVGSGFWLDMNNKLRDKPTMLVKVMAKRVADEPCVSMQ
jgi:hypothetical protein